MGRAYLARQGDRTACAIVVLVVVALVSGCAVKLAPNYDRGLVDRLAKANEDAMILFASVSATAPGAFDKREDVYNGLIGRFDALRLQSQTRPTPHPFALQMFGIGPDPSKDAKDPTLLAAPTPKILQAVIDVLTKMRDTDKKQGLTEHLVQGFKSSYETSMDQILTYEKALER